MSEKSNIEWTSSSGLFPNMFAAFELAHVADAVWFEVLKFVARMAVSDPVRHIVSKFWEIRERLYVVCSEVAASRVAAFLTGEIVSRKNRFAPPLIFWLSSSVKIALLGPVFPSMVPLASRRIRDCSSGNALAFCKAKFLSLARPRPAFQRRAHKGLRCGGMFPAFETRRSSLPVHSHFDNTATSSNRGQSISARSVSLKRSRRGPQLAFRAFFQTGCNSFTKFLNGNSSNLGCRYLSAFFCLSHS